MNDSDIQDYIKAGKGVIAAKKLAKTIIKPGVPLLEVANRCEEEIIKNGCELSFPINLSLNEIAAHYSPPIGDKTVVPEKGLLKIDIGSHFNGYIADSAFTINLDEDPILQNYVDAAKEAVAAAIDLFVPGVKLYELGEAIAQKIINRGLRPITNLGGHELKQFTLHAGAFIPNYKEKLHNQVLKPGDAYACEPFATSGVGKVENGAYSYIFRFVKKAKRNLSYEQQGYMNKIKKNFKNLPFSPRWIINRNLIPKDKILRTIESFLGRKILDKYQILIERAKEPVAQEEHTIILDIDGKKIVTTQE
ncbi:MAG: type II methionyl aminopeptidase [Candidatus Lokiarchaeota archaeon]|nr:type II methionyl aminopeptidase [Candidatus Lokiarchaeota archaeon]